MNEDLRKANEELRRLEQQRMEESRYKLQQMMGLESKLPIHMYFGNCHKSNLEVMEHPAGTILFYSV